MLPRMNRHVLLRRITQGDVKSIAFQDLHQLVLGLGFETARTRGSDHIYVHGRTGAFLTSRRSEARQRPTSELWIEAARERGREIPRPRYRPAIYQVSA